MGEAAELTAQLFGQEPAGMNVPGIDNRQMALNIMHWLSRQLEPWMTAPTTGIANGFPQRCRRFPCVIFARPGWP